MSDDHHGRRAEEPCWPEPWTTFSARTAHSARAPGALSLFLCEAGSGPGGWMRLGVGQRHLQSG